MKNLNKSVITMSYEKLLAKFKIYDRLSILTLLIDAVFFFVKIQII